jgi:hypothetical protein
MTIPTSGQLAANVPPAIRMYIDAKVSEAVAAVTNDFHMGLQALNGTADHVEQRLKEIEVLEKTVRGMMGL